MCLNPASSSRALGRSSPIMHSPLAVLDGEGLHPVRCHRKGFADGAVGASVAAGAVTDHHARLHGDLLIDSVVAVALHPDRKTETLLAEIVHWLLYGSLILVPLSGWIHHAATEGFAPIWCTYGLVCVQVYITISGELDVFRVVVRRVGDMSLMETLTFSSPARSL